MTAPTHRAAVLEPNCSQASGIAQRPKAEIERNRHPPERVRGVTMKVERLPLVVSVLREFNTDAPGKKGASRIQGCDARVRSRTPQSHRMCCQAAGEPFRFANRPAI
jgi:hypothetical protein